MWITLLPNIINDAGEQDINERDGEVKEEPDVNHLDVGGDWEVGNNGDEHAGENKHNREINSNCRFKVKGFEVVSDVSNDIEEDRGVRMST